MWNIIPDYSAKSITVNGTGWNQTVLQYINEKYPELEELNLKGFSDDFFLRQTRNPVRFKNVKRFSVSIFGLMKPRRNVFWEFDQLEEITHFYDNFKDDFWFRFFILYDLKKLLISWEPWNQWKEIVYELPSLIEVKGKWVYYCYTSCVNAGDMRGLLTDKNNLQKVTIIVDSYDDVPCALANREFPGWYSINKDNCSDSYEVTFIRKHD